MANERRVALVWTASQRLVEMSVRFERFAHGFRALGCDVLTVCRPEAAEGYEDSLQLAPNEAALSDPEFWRGLRIDVAVVVTWLVLPDAVAALKRAGAYVISIADSDGLVGVRVHPGSVLRRMVAQHAGPMRKARAAKFWLQQWLVTAPAFDRPKLDSATHADRIAVGCPAARDHLSRFFAHYRRPDLAAKVVVVPYPVDDGFLRADLPAKRPRQVVAVGRWDDPQKDSALLARTIERFICTGGIAEFAIIGPGGEKAFAGLTRRSAIRYLGAQTPSVVADLLRTSRVLLLPSRWEGAPVVLNEALASGCTVVGTDSLPAVVSVCAEGPFGTVSRGRSSRRLAEALARELSAWDRGERDSAKTAAYWRPRFDPMTVCEQLLG